jgi:hypothetical protein
MTRALSTLALLLVILPAGAGAELAIARSEEREPCRDQSATRNPYFGDLHVHTTYSLDANTQDTRARPADAYRFARGDRLEIQPFDANGKGLRSLQLERPLDFAAVTDHAEYFGEIRTCQTPGMPGHDTLHCTIFRSWPRLAYYLFNSRGSMTKRRYGWCGEDGEICKRAAKGPWQEMQDAAEAAYDRSERCEFTSFVAYEWTGSGGRDASNLHRNVVFRNHAVPELPISFVDQSVPQLLWTELDAACAERGESCDFVSIPHNSNISAEKMFQTVNPDGSALSAADARLRSRAEPIVEMIQHKGESECLLGSGSEDELCSFEQLPYDSFMGARSKSFRTVPGPMNFVRNVLGEGLVQHEKVGDNPFQLGFIGSTDTHLGAPGAVSERRHAGHGGAGPPVTELPTGLTDQIEFNPGGLAVLWAEENSRDALFAALKRRETYATSGPRIALRLFAGWDYPEALCKSSNFAEQGYLGGVPMGGTLRSAPNGARSAAPTLALSTLMDAGSAAEPGASLQRAQIVKVWLEDGAAKEKAYDIAGDPNNGASVDLDTCTPQGSGFESLCSVWTDPDFLPNQRALYYARVLENPTCRWSTWICKDLDVDCSDPGSLDENVAGCCDESYPKTIQERAWSSPIWYEPR